MNHKRKLPPDAMLAALIRFGFRVGDIADRFEVDPQRVSERKTRLGFDPTPPGTVSRRNGAAPANRYFG